MPNQPPLNPDALANLRLLADRATEELRHAVIEPDILHKLLDLAVAQPAVTGEQVNLAGWTCDGIHEPGSYATCEDCRGACDDLANFYNNMMQQPKADGPWTGRPAVKP
ncbi:hypothetical protein ACNPON_18650 [Glutamicibacter sp. AGC13]